MECAPIADSTGFSQVGSSHDRASHRPSHSGCVDSPSGRGIQLYVQAMSIILFCLAMAMLVAFLSTSMPIRLALAFVGTACVLAVIIMSILYLVGGPAAVAS